MGSKNDREVRSLCRFLPKMSAYRRDFDETKCTFFIHARKKVIKPRIRLAMV